MYYAVLSTDSTPDTLLSTFIHDHSCLKLHNLCTSIIPIFRGEKLRLEEISEPDCSHRTGEWGSLDLNPGSLPRVCAWAQVWAFPVLGDTGHLLENTTDLN